MHKEEILKKLQEIVTNGEDVKKVKIKFNNGEKVTLKFDSNNNEVEVVVEVDEEEEEEEEEDEEDEEEDDEEDDSEAEVEPETKKNNTPLNTGLKVNVINK